MKIHIVQLCVITLLLLCNQAYSGTKAPIYADAVPSYDLLALDHVLTEILDSEIKPIRGKERRLKALHRLLYYPENFGITYRASKTQTAMETFYQRAGNCVSLSNLFVATARYVGLDARYQSVRVKKTWFPQDGFYEVPGHMNVIVKMGRENAVIEFNAAFFDNLQTNKLHTKIISDRVATAEFYNNLGADRLVDKNPQDAIGFFLKALDYGNKLDFIWSNLGVAYKQAGDFSKAEESYIRALELNKYNNSAISNIYLLYSQLDETSKSKRYAEKAEKYARKNPYYLAKIADEHIEKQDYKEAVKILKKAINIYKSEPQFHHALSSAYYYQGKITLSRKALERARRYSELDGDKRRYQQKIQSLAKLQ